MLSLLLEMRDTLAVFSSSLGVLYSAEDVYIDLQHTYDLVLGERAAKVAPVASLTSCFLCALQICFLLFAVLYIVSYCIITRYKRKAGRCSILNVHMNGTCTCTSIHLPFQFQS